MSSQVAVSRKGGHMNWIHTNINHFTVPLGMLLGLIAAFFGFTVQRKRKAGLPPPYISEGVRNSVIVVLIICAVLLGVAIANNIG